MRNRGWFREIRGWSVGHSGSRLVEYGDRNIKWNRGCDSRILGGDLFLALFANNPDMF